MENNSKIILEVKGLKKYFPLQRDLFGRPKVNLRAVDDVSFKLEAGKTIGVVGESGCGKTTLGRTILQLYDTTGGKSLYYGHTLEDALPKYYIDGIKKIPALALKYNNLKVKVTELLKEFSDYSSYEINDELVLSDYTNILNVIKNDISLLDKESNKEQIKKLNKVVGYLEKLVNVLDEASVISGGLILADPTKAKELLVKKVVKENELYKAYVKKEKISKKLGKSNDENNQSQLNVIEEEINSIALELEKYNEELIEFKNNINQSPLYLDLEARREKGLDLARLTKSEMRSLRTEIQLIFQDPYSSLPPRMTIGSILTEPVQVHQIVDKENVSEHVHKVMKMCGLQPQYYDRYPHEFSGGQRQRICIARALVVNPKLVICDEPVSALDVSIQAQIINLLKELQNNLGLTYMFISHDLSVVKYITDSIIVMYLGNMMEIGDTKDIFQNPLHPYTQALFSAVPVPDPEAKMNRIILKGDIPSPANPPKGCKFHTRCEKCMGVCKFKTPKFIQYDDNHLVACHLYDEEVMANLEKYDAELLEIERIEQEKAQAIKEKEEKKITISKIVKKVFKKKNE